MKFFCIVLSALCIAGSAFADTPVVYSKTVIKIIPASDKTEVAEHKEEDKKKNSEDKKANESSTVDLMPALHRVEKEFTVEVRPLSFLSQKDFIANQPFTDREGMMMIISPPAQTQLRSANLLGKTDVLFVLEDGTIYKIAPDLSLPDLVEPIDSEKVIKALIFLKNGMSKMSDIKPGDSVASPQFKTHPVILQ